MEIHYHSWDMNIDENNMCIFVVNARLRVSELLGRSLMINPYSTNLFDEQICYPPLRADLKLLLISGSHREDAFGIDFGLGKAVALRIDSNKYDGKVVFCPAREGKASANLEVCLSQDAMVAFQ
ncbi:LOW QUALITY PROTEIN: hypothetical protein V2J09_000098 [Rumex salicifolius]